MTVVDPAAALGAVDYGFRVTDELAVEILRLGAEGQPVLVVDEIMERPAPLVAYAERQARFAAVQEAGNFYPGLRAPAPKGYVEGLYSALRPLMAQTFGYDPGAPARISCALSLATLAPAKLNVAQRLPHVDTPDPRQFAVLHYLCDASHGGTAFYRHRATGFETIDAARAPDYLARLGGEIERDGPPPAAYVRGATPLFDQIGRVEARFNRVVIYRSQQLHAGVIERPESLSPDPRQGRLTANTFVTLE